jgi:hypothetical protein
VERGSGYLDRLSIAGLVAVHMVRNPSFRHHLVVHQATFAVLTTARSLASSALWLRQAM